jgi:hypothetical protein
MPADSGRTHLVIFCGAGFTAPFGLPVMGNFSDRLRSAGHLGEHQADFDAIQLQCDALGAFIGGSARNLEQLASFLSMLRITRPDFEFPGCKKYRTPAQAMKLVLECMRRMVCPELEGQSVRSATEPLFKFKDAVKLSFITTNYDLVIEFAALSHTVRTVPTPDILGACDSITDHSSLYRAPGQTGRASIYKLHGSVNWFSRREGGIRVLSMFDHRAAPPEANTWRTELLGPGDSELPADCVMVPPAVLKPDLLPLLGPQWKGASEAISSADLLWFIGYSFPETDSFMRYFLASSLFTNVRLRQLTVIDPTVDVGRRAKQLFRMPSLEQVFHTIPMRWMEVHYEYLLRGDVASAAGQLNLERLARQDQIWELLRGNPGSGSTR